MSRAFTKEDGPELPDDPAERPLSPHPNYVTPRGAALLQREEERLVAALAAYDGAQDDPARRRKKRELERDLRYVRARRDAAILVEPANQPKDEIRFGARATLGDDGSVERVVRIVGEDEAAEGGEFLPWPAPFAQALFGLKAGQGLDWEGDSGPEHWTVLTVEYPRLMEELLQAAVVVWRSPECRRLVDIIVWLSSVTGGFWLLARAMGAAVEIFAELFWESLWGAFATLYNIALAVFFAAILFASATKGAPAGDLYWREACGFVVLYLALSAAYTDPRTNGIDEYSRPGFATALVAYMFFAAVPSLVAHPVLYDLIALMKAVADSWVGTASTALVVVGIVVSLSRRGLRAMFARLSPFLWFIGALKHPPIRVRDDG